MVAEHPDELLTPAGVALLLFVDPETVARWEAAGKLTSILTPGGHRRYLRSEVLAMVAGLHPRRHGHGPLLDPDRDLSNAPVTDPLRRGSAPIVVASCPDLAPGRAVAAAAVVAEAVALASEAAAVEAAKSVLATAAAVSRAAVVAAEAADRARAARAYAAQAAARSVAEEARRTALHVRDRATLAAACVRHAAALAAAELIGGSDLDTTFDAAHAATTMAATVRAAAAATDVLTAGAARAVVQASSVAAEHVALQHSAAEEAFAREVNDAADTQRELAAAAAVSVALETSARALGVATVASEAAAAVHDEHHRGLAIDATPAIDQGIDQGIEPGIDSSRLGLSTHGSAHLTGFAAELSHDLRGPLTSIMANVELLQLELEGLDEAGIIALLGGALRASDRMVRILDHYMSPGVAGGPLAPCEVDLALVVGQFLADAADHLGQVGAVVDVGELPVLRVDPDAMYSVFQNLLTNAVKFARPGVPAVVAVSAQTTDNGWRISVRDNGVGLTDAGGRDMFALFIRGHTEVPGHGIGLATVARVVAEHGGHVGFTPVRTGAEIWFELPSTHGLG